MSKCSMTYLCPAWQQKECSNECIFAPSPNSSPPVRQESATEFMLRKARTWEEWLTIGEPRTTARIRECIRRYPKPEARAALIETCMFYKSVTGKSDE